MPDVHGSHLETLVSSFLHVCIAIIEITTNFTRVMVKSPFWADEITPTGLMGMDSKIASSLVNCNRSEGYKLDPIYLVTM